MSDKLIWRFPSSLYTGHNGRVLPHYDAQYLGYYLDVLTLGGEKVVRDLDVDWTRREGHGFPIEVDGMPAFIDFSDWPTCCYLGTDIIVKEARECPMYFKASMLAKDMDKRNIFPVGPTIGGRPGGAFGAGEKHERLLYWENFRRLRNIEPSYANFLYGYLAGVRDGEPVSAGEDGIRRAHFVKQILKAGIEYDPVWAEPLPFWARCTKATAILDAVGSRPETIGRKLVEGLGLGCAVMSNAGIRRSIGPYYQEFDDSFILFVDKDEDVGRIWKEFTNDSLKQRNLRQKAAEIYDTRFEPHALCAWMVECAEKAKKYD